MEKIIELKKLFKKYDLDGYLIPKNDEFFGEYVAEEEDRLKFITNFSGSYGFALILKDKNYLFVDGRYTLQAKRESGKNFNIITMPKLYPYNILKSNKLRIGFDPKLYTQRMINYLFKKKKLISINVNLVDKIWKKKKVNNISKFFILKKSDTGQDSKSKITKISRIFRKKKIDYQFISAPENIAWLLNLRGEDSNFSPIPNSYMILKKNNIINLFCNPKKINNKLKKKLRNVKIKDINEIEIFLDKLKNKKVQIDQLSCSVFFKDILKKNNMVIEQIDPTYYLKSVKNKIEVKNSYKSNIYDGVALTKFLFWLKKNFQKKKITEVSAQNKLLQFRKKNKYFKFPSFPTISGSGSNGAIIHYRANSKTNKTLKKKEIYLVDSGGQYNFGTTDVTRTISFGNNNKRIKDIFTRVLKGHIAVANFEIKNSTNGHKIDQAARKPLKQVNLSYPHGTGHGVGYFLNVHEGPVGFSKRNKTKLCEGMIISNEPGYYKAGQFGIRIENLIVVKKINKSYVFDNLTMVPIDRNLIEKKILNTTELNWINNYHEQVYNILNKYMFGADLKLLKESCSKI